MNIKSINEMNLSTAIRHCKKLKELGYDVYFEGRGNGKVKLMVEFIEITRER